METDYKYFDLVKEKITINILYEKSKKINVR